MTDPEYAHWSRFWDEGYITTFGDSKPRNYDGVVRAFWEEKFAELPDGAAILDIAAGNGAIATIAAETGIRRGRTFVVAATDIADIQPQLIGDEATSQARATIDFRSRTPCEQQPFDDDAFQVVTSQFGFEYSDIARTLPEIRRVLAPGGRFIAISHHVDSTLIEEARSEHAIYDAAFDELDLLGATRRLFECLGDVSEDDLDAGRQNEDYRAQVAIVNERVKQFQQRHGGDERSKFIVGTISYIARTARKTTLRERLEAIDKASADFRSHRARLADMVAAALDVQDTEQLTVMARETGFDSVHCLKFYAGDDRLAGWQIHLR